MTVFKYIWPYDIGDIMIVTHGPKPNLFPFEVVEIDSKGCVTKSKLRSDLVDEAQIWFDEHKEFIIADFKQIREEADERIKANFKQMREKD